MMLCRAGRGGLRIIMMLCQEAMGALHILKGIVMLIEKDWKALIGNACWSWILAWIPVPFKAISIASTSYKFDGDDTLTYETGIISKRDVNIDLRRVKSISASDSPFAGGKLVIIENNGAATTLPYVKNARAVADQLRHMVDASSRARGDVQNRIIA
jgi:uncharacterized membrane protein YdbT with pleckstrin-like domain